MERQTGSIDPISPQYISQTLNVSLEDVERFLQDLNTWRINNIYSQTKP